MASVTKKIDPRLVALLLALMSCKSSPATPPPRPASVPADAVWSGGADGGAFIRCTPATGIDLRCTVWNDFTGDVWMKGVFRPSTATPLVLTPGANPYAGVDGERIFLVSGGYLSK